MSTEENTKLLIPRPEMRIRGAGLAFPVAQSGVSQRENPDVNLLRLHSSRMDTLIGKLMNLITAGRSRLLRYFLGRA
jgi:hypothetical protein